MEPGDRIQSGWRECAEASTEFAGVRPLPERSHIGLLLSSLLGSCPCELIEEGCVKY